MYRKNLLKLYGKEFRGDKTIFEKAKSTRIKRSDEQNTLQSTTELKNDSSKNVDLIRGNTVPEPVFC